jgi:hypothetical protein
MNIVSNFASLSLPDRAAANLSSPPLTVKAELTIPAAAGFARTRLRGCRSKGSRLLWDSAMNAVYTQNNHAARAPVPRKADKDSEQ